MGTMINMNHQPLTEGMGSFAPTTTMQVGDECLAVTSVNDATLPLPDGTRSMVLDLADCGWTVLVIHCDGHLSKWVRLVQGEDHMPILPLSCDGSLINHTEALINFMIDWSDMVRSGNLMDADSVDDLFRHGDWRTNGSRWANRIARRQLVRQSPTGEGSTPADRRKNLELD